MKQAMIGYVQKEKYDHFDTPDYAVRPLLPYVPKRWKIWEPTDTTGKSRITALLRENGNEVIATHAKKLNFLADTPKFEFDCIVTNPPYSLKDEFIRRCIEFGKRWALLLPITALEGVNRRKMFQELGSSFGVLVLDRRVEYTGGSVWFNTSWFCYGLLPRPLLFAELRKE
jgi:hypothetical protein